MKTIHTIPCFAAAWLASSSFLAAEESNESASPDLSGEIAERTPGPETGDPDPLEAEIQRFRREIRRGELMLPEVGKVRIDVRTGEAWPDDDSGVLEFDLSNPKIQRLFHKVREHHPSPPTTQPQAESPRWIIGLTVEPIEPFVRRHLKLDGNTGVRVSYLMENGAAAKAGIQVDDILVSADGKPLHSLDALKKAVANAGKEGKPLKLEVVQQGERKTLTISPTDTRPETTARPAGELRERPLVRIDRRLERHQREIEQLRKEVKELKKKLERSE